MPCTVTTSADGKLRYRLRWKGLPGYESKESTGIPADREHRDERRKMEHRAALISAEMAAGKFDYLAWFPNGSKADYLRKQTDGTTLRQYAETTWLPRMVPPAVRAWCSYDYRKHMNKHILSALGDFRLADVTTAKIVTFRADLLAKGLSMKSCRNVIDATLRACLRDA